MTGNIVRADFRRARSIEGIMASVMAEARHCARMSEAEFAAALDRRVARHPGFIDGTVIAWEAGDAAPAADVLGHALELAGVDVGELAELLFSRRRRQESDEPQPSAGLPG